MSDERDQSVPWGTGLTVAGFVAAVTGVAIVVLSLGLIRVHPLLAVGAQHRGGRRAGADPVGMAAHAGAALVCHGRSGGRGACCVGGAALILLALPAGRARSALAPGADPQQHILPSRNGRLASSAADRLFPRRVFRRRRALRTRGGPPAPAGAADGLKSGSISSLAASSTAVTVPPWAPGVKQKCARLSDRPAFHASCTVQRPSSLRQASQLSLSGFEAAHHQRGGDGLQQRQHRGTVGEDWVCGRCQLRGTQAFQQHRVGEPLDPRDVGARRRGYLLDRRARADSRLNFLWAQHVSDLDFELRLLQQQRVAAHSRPQSVVDRQFELFRGAHRSRRRCVCRRHRARPL